MQPLWGIRKGVGAGNGGAAPTSPDEPPDRGHYPRPAGRVLAQVHEHERVLVQRLRDQEAHAVFEGIAAGIEGRTMRGATARLPSTPAVAHARMEDSDLLDPVDPSTLPTFEEYR